jgi:flagellar biosynthesis protein FlhA
MPPTTATRAGSAIGSVQGLILPITIIGAILVFVVPIPPLLLDVLLSLNLTVAVVVLLTTLAVASPLDFSAFPTVLLTTTLTRLVLNVATTRLVLTRGAIDGVEAAGSVIRAFGEFVARDQVIVGVILFSILVVIQFAVITQGSTRISEVAARFMLDGLPGRQMAIDADLHAGLITGRDAQRLREDVYRQADFFGAMDGASRFVRGDAIAGVIILVVNVCGGLLLGIVNHGMSLSAAVNVFTKLTIGDGLVSQVPAFLTSLAAGLIVTRSSLSRDLSRDVIAQLFSQPNVLFTAAAFLGLMALTPLPKLPLIALAGLLCAAAAVLRSSRASAAPLAAETKEHGSAKLRTRSQVDPRETLTNASSEPRHSPTSSPDAAGAATEISAEQMEELLHVDPLELEIGFRLVTLVDPARGGDLLERLKTVRQSLAREMGLIVPQVRIHDNLSLAPHQYRVKIRGTIVGQGISYAGRLLAIPPSGLISRPDGRDGVDPITGQSAVWIHADGREVAQLAGCRILEATGVIAGHFAEIVTSHAHELLTRDVVERLLERVRSSAPTLVSEVVPGLLRAGELQRILQNLLRERVSIRDLETILETLALHAGSTREIHSLSEYVRQSLGRQIMEAYRGPDGRLRLVTLARPLDARIAAAATQADTRPSDVLGEDTTTSIVRAVATAVRTLVAGGQPPLILTSAGARAVLKDLTRADLPHLIVLSQNEIPRDTSVEVLGIVVEEQPEALTTYTTTETIV